ncbi:heme/hemin ABC transporter substrate-binding protein [Ruegeria arenilitoris]|uniref:Hemin-binding periplasmic protein HmuT n=1 Tax=Ruegeria arenilitoris TaxID=1173585 RepID=A0A238KW59_9RHOB|nr:ABC transporter substrate-binding protein [Ruegeria arenilitoris]SMX47035.1 Hemin-binding periplasmic protein HmuT precursor [Ruegeria arenilitoris]
MRGLVTLCAALLASAAVAQAESKRVIAIGSSLTEIVHALGQQHRLVGRDRSSTWPPEAADLPDVGYRRALSPEGVLSVAPDLILALEGSGPPETIAVLQEAGVDYITIADEFSRDGVIDKIRAVGAALGVEAEAEALAAETARRLDRALAQASDAQDAPVNVLFLLSARGSEFVVGGAETQADTIIRMAGGKNAAAGVTGFKTMTPEAMAATAPDVILMMERQGEPILSEEELFALPAVRLTPAGRNRALIRMPGAYLLGFGPRTADAVMDLSAALRGVRGS